MSVTKLKKSRYWCFAFPSLQKQNNISKQTCLQIIILLNLTTSANIKKYGKQVNRNIPTTSTTIINVNNDVYTFRDFEKAMS